MDVFVCGGLEQARGLGLHVCEEAPEGFCMRFSHLLPPFYRREVEVDFEEWAPGGVVIGAV